MKTYLTIPGAVSSVCKTGYHATGTVHLSRGECLLWLLTGRKPKPRLTRRNCPDDEYTTFDPDKGVRLRLPPKRNK